MGHDQRRCGQCQGAVYRGHRPGSQSDEAFGAGWSFDPVHPIVEPLRHRFALAGAKRDLAQPLVDFDGQKQGFRHDLRGVAGARQRRADDGGDVSIS